MPYLRAHLHHHPGFLSCTCRLCRSVGPSDSEQPVDITNSGNEENTVSKVPLQNHVKCDQKGE